MQNLKEGIKTEEICDRCGKGMVIKVGKFGPFVACSGYPDCTNTRELEKSEPDADTDETQDETCENCGKPMVVKRGRFGQFLACTGYPECKTTRKIISAGRLDEGRQAGSDPRREVPEVRVEPRHQAGALRRVHGVHELSELQVREDEDHGRALPEGRAATSSSGSRAAARPSTDAPTIPTATSRSGRSPIAEACPDCGTPFLLEKITKKAGRQLVCSKEDCALRARCAARRRAGTCLVPAIWPSALSRTWD